MKHQTIIHQPDGRYNKKVFIIQDFDSIGDLTSYLATAPTSQLFRDKNLSSQNEDRAAFYGTNTYNEANDMLIKGWDAKAPMLAQRIKANETTTHQAQRRTPTYNMVGGQASVPRYLQGIPTNMIDHKQTPVKQKIITINKDLAYAANVRTSEIEAEGIKALQIIKGLEGKGFRVKLNTIWVSSVGNTFHTVKVCVKRPEERMNLLKMAFPLIHPSMLRRFGFRCLETNPHVTERSFTWGYGAPDGGMYRQIMAKGEYLLPAYIPSVDKLIEQIGGK